MAAWKLCDWGKNKPGWGFSWGRSEVKHQIWNQSSNEEGEWGQQSLRHVESPVRTRFQKQQAVNMAVLKMADEPKPWSEPCWLSRSGAEGENSAGTEDLYSSTWAQRWQVERFSCQKMRQACTGSITKQKKNIPVRRWMCWILGIEFKCFPALFSFDTMLTMAPFNRYFRGNFTQHPRDFIKVNMTNCDIFPEESLTTGLHQFCEQPLGCIFNLSTQNDVCWKCCTETGDITRGTGWELPSCCSQQP